MHVSLGKTGRPVLHGLDLQVVHFCGQTWWHAHTDRQGQACGSAAWACRLLIWTCELNYSAALWKHTLPACP